MKNILQATLIALLAAFVIPPFAAAAKGVIPKCPGRVVWVIPSQKVYVLSNNPLYAKKPGAYVCESHAIARGYHMRPLNIMRPQKNTATPTPGANATPVASMSIPENPNLTTLARSQIDIMRTGKINRSQYGDQLNKVLTDSTIAQLSQALAVGGAVTSFSYAGTADYSGLPVAQYLVAFEHPVGTTNQWIESIAADPTGKVLFLSFAPKT